MYRRHFKQRLGVVCLKRKTLSFPFLILFLLIPLVSGTAYYDNTNFHFGFGTGSYINFSPTRTFTSHPYIEGNGWRFDNYWFSTSSANATISSWYQNNWLNYTVTGAGTQQTYYTGSKPSNVYLNGVLKSENDGWSYFAGTTTITGATANASLFWAGSNNPPSYTSTSVNTTLAGKIALLTCGWTDDSGLSYGKLGHNATGPWQNQTLKALSGTFDTFIDTVTLPPSVGTIVWYRFYANDTSNQWTATPILTLTTTEETMTGVLTTYTLQIKVTDSNRILQTNARVAVWTLQGQAVIIKTTDTSGTVKFTLQPNTYLVTAEKDDVASETVKLDKDTTITLTIGLTPSLKPFSQITEPIAEVTQAILGSQIYTFLAGAGGFILLGVAFLLGIVALLYDTKWLLIITTALTILGILTLISIYITPIF